ncbi:MAG: Cof-type HAD-IIB family hydrolase [Synergistaceae bacterium]|jgi:Cof subfamily protein (haloacid dehalogenase superfamily)|nr:Cof-type HAD-IIB family hydrolase [Synergistaceae bacterium]
MASVKLIATDLDGTLLDSTGEIPERNFKIIKEAMAGGVAFTVCTGRMFRSAMRFAEQLGVKLPLICYNGAMLKRLDGEVIWHKPLDLGIAKELLSVFRERGVHVQSYVDDVVYVRSGGAEAYNEYSRTFGVTGEAVGDDLYNPQSPPTKLLGITGTDKEAESLVPFLSGKFGDEIYVTRSNSNFVEVMNKDVNKAKGLAKLAGIMGIQMCDVMAVGDGENDVEMVAMAGFGIAMDNGAEKIKKAAFRVAPTNDENGVSWAVERFALRA